MIEQNALVCGGDPVVAGTRITCWHLYVLRCDFGKSVDWIRGQYPQLSAPDIEEAVAYVLAHPEVRRDHECPSCGNECAALAACASCGRKICWKCGMESPWICRECAMEGRS